MPLLKLFLILFSSLILCSLVTFAQNDRPTNLGQVTGIVRDSTHNYALQHATLAIYKKIDTSLISYQLTNNFGEFHFDKLPIEIPLLVKATFVGYITEYRTIVIPSSKNIYDLKNFNMERSTNVLDEIAIIAEQPPVRMNGDTLEFNAQAFKLDTNAVVEDLLKKLPGVEIWSDGMITINGKTVSKVLVEGKDFFGGNAKVAIQNLPKNSVNKIQVYTENAGIDPINAKTNVNIVLRKDKKDGLFGKIEGGFGTNKRYDNNGMVNYFDPKNQVSVVSSLNNVNKTANSVEGLFNYNSFKGESLGNTYASDFNKKGVNIFKSIGFSAANSPDNNSSLKANYFLSDLKSETGQNMSSTFALTDISAINRYSNNFAEKNGYSQNGKVSYKDKSLYSEIYVQGGFTNTSLTQTEQTSEVTTNSLYKNSATFLSNNMSEYAESQFSFNAGYNSYPMARLNHHPILSFNLDYAFSAFNNANDRTRVSELKGEQGTINNSFNRRYNEKNNNKTHYVTFSKDNIFGVSLSNLVNASIVNTLEFNQSEKRYATGDFQEAQKEYVRNDSLSFIGEYKILDEKPALVLKKTFLKNLSNRYSKVFSIDIVARAQFYSQMNKSTIDYQNINRAYSKFIPSSSISYRDQKMQRYNNLYSLTYNTGLIYPQLDQLVPLVDQADGFYLNYGNLSLRPGYRHEVIANFRHEKSLGTPFIYNASLRAGLINNHLSDSTLYDEVGRIIHYTVNVNNQRYTGLSGNFMKSYKVMKSSEVQLGYQGTIYLYQNPIYVNNAYMLSKVLTMTNSLDFTYSYNSLLTLRLAQSLETFQSSQRSYGIRTDSKNTLTNTLVAAKFGWPKHVTLNSSVSYSKSTSPGALPINFTIWNANISYRFFKGENGEVKFSALDILNQNTGLISYGSYNNITRGTARVLRQYFMISLSYYPRKFGLNTY